MDIEKNSVDRTENKVSVLEEVQPKRPLEATIL
jgi:hypothetical protein